MSPLKLHIKALPQNSVTPPPPQNPLIFLPKDIKRINYTKKITTGGGWLAPGHFPAQKVILYFKNTCSVFLPHIHREFCDSLKRMCDIVKSVPKWFM
jgi:hypothetical protein